MTDLFDRLFPGSPDSSNIAVHAFHAAVVDYIAGETTRQQIIDHWQLDAEAQSDLNSLLDDVDSVTGATNKVGFSVEFDAVMKLAAHGIRYTTKTNFNNRLGQIINHW